MIRETRSLAREAMRSREKQQKRWRIITVLLVILSIQLLTLNPVYQRVVTYRVENNLQQLPLDKVKGNPYVTSSKKQMDTSNQEIYVGKMAIPSVDMFLPIVKGMGEANLYRGAATNMVNQRMGEGNYSLSAHKMPHNDTLLFSPLLKVKMNETIYLSEGAFVYTYVVDEIFSVTPDEIEILDEVPGKKIVTLYTCETDAGDKRYVVRGTLTDITPVKDTDEKILKWLDK